MADKALRFRIYVGTQPGSNLTPETLVRTVRNRAKAASENLQGATVLPGVGVWEGELEATATIEWVHTLSTGSARNARRSAWELAERLGEIFEQAVVMVTEEETRVTFVPTS